LAVCFLAFVSATGAASAGDKAAGIDAIRAYEGSWEISIEHLDTAHSKAGVEKTLLRNDCWKSGGYYACNQIVNGESKVLLVFTYDAAKNLYTSYPIPQDGSEAGSGKLRIDGNTWTYPWQVKEGDKTTWYRVVNVFTAPDHIEFRQEFSEDNVHWTLMARGKETRVSGK
jgi:hypothetical protein